MSERSRTILITGGVGFITCKMSSEQTVHILGERVGSIPLNAVDPEFRRPGPIGEYVGRTYTQSQGRPLYVIRERFLDDEVVI